VDAGRLQGCDSGRSGLLDAHKDELYAQREAIREAARQAELAALAETHRERVEAAKKVAAAYPISARRKSAREPGGGPQLRSSIRVNRCVMRSRLVFLLALVFILGVGGAAAATGGCGDSLSDDVNKPHIVTYTENGTVKVVTTGP
jgi:hypothetical protein